jgi:hypothetical protein
MDNDLPPLITERPRPARKKSFLGGLAVSRDGKFAIDCTIRDLSEGGAKVKIAKGHLVPEHFYLLISSRMMAHEALITWVRGNEFGVKFLAGYSFETMQTADLQFLRRIMAERLPRNSVAL